jgi:hypothetical protein
MVNNSMCGHSIHFSSPYISLDFKGQFRKKKRERLMAGKPFFLLRAFGGGKD